MEPLSNSDLVSKDKDQLIGTSFLFLLLYVKLQVIYKPEESYRGKLMDLFITTVT